MHGRTGLQVAIAVVVVVVVGGCPAGGVDDDSAMTGATTTNGVSTTTGAPTSDPCETTFCEPDPCETSCDDPGTTTGEPFCDGTEIDTPSGALCCQLLGDGDGDPIVLRAHTLEVMVVVDNEPPPADISDAGVLNLETMRGDRLVLGSTHEGAFSTRYTTGEYGTFQLVYTAGDTSTTMPINSRAVVSNEINIFGDSALYVDLQTATITGQVLFDGQPPPASGDDYGYLDLVDVFSGARFPIAQTSDNGGLFSAVIIPGDYELRYRVGASGGIAPLNADALLAEVFVPSQGNEDLGTIDVPLAPLTAEILVNGVLPPVDPANNGALFLVDESSGDAIKIGETIDGVVSAVVIGGDELTYGLFYSAIASDLAIPANTWGHLADVGTAYELASTINVPMIEVAGAVTLDGVQPPSDPDEVAEIRLTTADGDALTLGTTTQGALGAALLPGAYDLTYGVISTAGALPLNVAATIAQVEFDAPEPNFAVDVSTVMLTTTTTVDGAKPPNDPGDRGEIVARIGDDRFVLATTDAPATIRVLPGNYDISFNPLDVGATMPILPGTVQEDVTFEAPNVALDVDLTTAAWAAPLVLELDPPKGAGEAAAILLRPLGGDAQSEVAIATVDDETLSATLLPGTYEIIYRAQSVGDGLPANDGTLLSCVAFTGV